MKLPLLQHASVLEQHWTACYISLTFEEPKWPSLNLRQLGNFNTELPFHLLDSFNSELEHLCIYSHSCLSSRQYSL